MGVSSRLIPASFVRCPQPAPDSHYAGRRHAISFRKCFAPLFGKANFCRFSVTQLGAMVSFAEVRGSMTQSIRRVFRRGGPAKIADMIVVSAAIVMRDLRVALARWFAEEGQRDKAVNVKQLLIAANAKPSVSITAPIRPSGTHSAVSEPLDAAHVGHGITRRFVYPAPFFVGIISVSHCALQSREGQGRAVLSAPFRPAFYRRNVPETQGAIT